MIIIIGASKGLGRTLAKKLSHWQNTLVLTGRNQQQLSAIADEIRETRKGKIFIRQLDLMHSKEVEEFVDFVVGIDEPVRAIVNTVAGYYKGSFINESIQSIDELVRTTFTGPIHLIAKMLQAARRSNPFDIVNITAVSAATNLDTSRSSIMHVTTKAAIHLFGLTAGRELSTAGVRFCSIAPGTFQRHEHLGIPESTIADCVDFVLKCPAEAWVESIVIRLTGK